MTAAGRRTGPCLRRRGREDPEPAGRCPGRGERLKAGFSSLRSPSAPWSTPRRPGRLPTGCRGREGVASPSGSGPRVTCPGDCGQCQAHALALSPRGSAGTTALRGHSTARGQDGQGSPTKPPSSTPRRSTRDPDGGAEPRVVSQKPSKT